MNDLTMLPVVWLEHHPDNPQMAVLYELLTSCGYRMCEEEKQYMDGTHEIYQRWEG